MNERTSTPDSLVVIPGVSFKLHYDHDTAMRRMGRLLASLAGRCGKTVDLGDDARMTDQANKTSMGLLCANSVLGLGGIAANLGGALTAGGQVITAAAHGFGEALGVFDIAAPNLTTAVVAAGVAVVGNEVIRHSVLNSASILAARAGYVEKMTEIATAKSAKPRAAGKAR